MLGSSLVILSISNVLLFFWWVLFQFWTHNQLAMKVNGYFSAQNWPFHFEVIKQIFWRFLSFLKVSWEGTKTYFFISAFMNVLFPEEAGDKVEISLMPFG